MKRKSGPGAAPRGSAREEKATIPLPPLPGGVPGCGEEECTDQVCRPGEAAVDRGGPTTTDLGAGDRGEEPVPAPKGGPSRYQPPGAIGERPAGAPPSRRAAAEERSSAGLPAEEDVRRSWGEDVSEGV